MAFWLRAATLILGKSTYDISGLDFSFDVPFEATEEPPVATVTVTNLSAKSRAAIKKNQKVVLNAGYEGNVGCILVGKVVGLKHRQSMTDWTTTITVLPCADKVLGQRINKTYKRGSKAKAIVQDLLNIYGVEVGKMQLAKDRSYPRGRVCKGKLINVLTDIVVNECKSRIITYPTGRIYITKTKSGIGNAIKLSESSGLLRKDEDTVAFEVERKKETSTEKAAEKSYTPRSCLLNYNIAPAAVVKIDSGDDKGTYTVEKGSHKGSRSGEWVTKMELSAYNGKSKSAAKKSAADAVKSKASKRKTLRFGDRGSSVKELQTILSAYGYGAPITSVFDQATRKAVIAFQKNAKLTANGVVNTATWNKLL